MLGRHTQGGLSAGLNHVQHGFGLGQVQPPVEEGTQSHLARLGRASAGRQRQPQNAAQRHNAPVGLDLHHVLPGVAVRTRYGHRQHFVHHIAGLWISNVSKSEAARLQTIRCTSRRHEKPPQNRGSFRAAYLHDAHPTLSQRCGNGGYGIVKTQGIHELNLLRRT